MYLLRYVYAGQAAGRTGPLPAPYGYPLPGGHGVMGSPFATLTKNTLQCYNVLIYNTIFIYPFLHTKAEAL